MNEKDDPPLHSTQELPDCGIPRIYRPQRILRNCFIRWQLLGRSNFTRRLMLAGLHYELDLLASHGDIE